jgi:glyoxylate/hydroxypyruvate reductase A
VAARRPPVSILVYRGDGLAAQYAQLIRVPRQRLRVHVAGTAAEADAAISGAEVVWTWRLPPKLYAKAPRLRWVQTMGAGVDSALVAELPSGVLVTRAPGIFGPWMAEYVLGWCLWVTQRMETYRTAQRERRWRAELQPERLAGQTLVVVGLGDIGRTIARQAKAVGMRVVGVSRRGRRVPGIARVYRTDGLTRALAEGDFVALVLPLTPATRGLIAKRELEAMKPTAWLLNLGRGPLVDETALLQALSQGRIAGAVLDVFATEPLPPEHPLWALDNAVITPHIAGPDIPGDIAQVFNDNLGRYLTGRHLRHLVDRRRGY